MIKRQGSARVSTLLLHQRDVNAPPREVGTHALLHARFQRRIEARIAQGNIEIAMIHRARLHRQGKVRMAHFAATIARHTLHAVYPFLSGTSSVLTDRQTTKGSDVPRFPWRLAPALPRLPGCPLPVAPWLRPGPGQFPHSSRWRTPSLQLSPARTTTPPASPLAALALPQPSQSGRVWH